MRDHQVERTGRAAAIAFEAKAVIESAEAFSSGGTIATFSDITALQDHLDVSAQSIFSEGTRSSRHLYVVEDLSRDLIETLGSRLYIPPSLFAAHFDDVAQVRYTKRYPVGQDARTRFTLHWPEMYKLAFEASTSKSENYAINSNIQRLVEICMPENKMLEREYDCMDCLASFWSVRVNNSWIAVLIVDRPLNGGDVLYSNDDGTPRTLLRTPQVPAFYPAIDTPELLLPYIDPQNTAEGFRITHCMFDNILFAFRHKIYTVTEDPASCTRVVRRIALSKWNGWIDRQSALVWQANDRMNPAHFRTSYRKFTLVPGWDGKWKVDEFGALVHAKLMASTIISMIVQNLHNLGMDNEGAIESSAVVDEQEAKEWKALMYRAGLIRELLQSITESYIQGVSVTESVPSNSQARSVAHQSSPPPFSILLSQKLIM